MLRERGSTVIVNKRRRPSKQRAREREKQTDKLGAQRHCPVKQEHGLCRVYQYMEQQNEIHVFESYRLFITLGLSTL
jgi:hypothetical protein